MSFSLASLSPYTDQLSTELISQALLKPYSVQMLTIMAGKTAGTSAINVLNSNPFIIDATCGFNTSTTGPGGATGNATVFSQIDLGYLVYSLDYLIKGMQYLLSSPKTEQGFY